MLEHDSQGFLTGTVVAGITRATDALMGIRSDIRAIRAAILSPNSGTPRGSRSSSGDSNPRHQQVSNAATPNSANSSNRDTSGRFVGSSNTNTVTPSGRNSNPAEPKQQATMLNGLANRIGNTISAGANGTQDSDPAIKSLMEVAEPMKRGYATFIVGGDKKERWFRKIFGELKLFRKEETVFNRASIKVLKSIEDKPVGGSDSGIGMILLSAGIALLYKWLTDHFGGNSKGKNDPANALPAVAAKTLGNNPAPLAKLASKIPGVSLLSNNVPVLGKVAGGLVKRLPLIGNVASAVMTGADILKNEANPELDRKQKDQANGSAIGGTTGGIAGVTAGAATGALVGSVVPIIGTAIGGLTGGVLGFFAGEKAGEIVGKYAGEYYNGLRSKQDVGSVDGKTSATDKQGGSRSWRNNNPGNIEYGDFSKQHGAVGTDGRFAVFPDHEAGRSALKSLLFESKNYKDKTLTEAIERYAPSHENDTPLYEKIVQSSVGGQNKKMFDYTDGERNAIADSIQKHEGWKSGEAVTAESVVEPNQGRYKYEALEGGLIQKTDNEAGTIELASEAESNAFRKKQGQPYLDRVAAINGMGTQSAHMPMPTAPKIPIAPPIQDSPGVVMPMGSGGEQKPLMVSLQQADVSRDLSDRRLAHIVTGGMVGNY